MECAGRISHIKYLSMNGKPFFTSLEDEFYFLFKCKLHNGLREPYIERYWNRPNIPKLTELFNSNNKKLSTNLGIYIYKALEFRSEQVIAN